MKTRIEIMLISLLSFFIFSFPILTNVSPAFAEPSFATDDHGTITDSHETNTDYSDHIAINGSGNYVFNGNGYNITLPTPNNIEVCTPAVYNCISAIFTVPNVEILDANGTKTEFVKVIFELDPATGELKLLYAEQ